MLNRLWFFFFISSFIACCAQFIFLGQDHFTTVINSLFSMSKTAVEISIGLIGLMCFWLGIFEIIEKSGLIHKLSKAFSPLFHVLMPEVPKNHPSHSAMTMNIAANMLGLDNAATPMGIKAMQSLQTINNEPQRATNAQILFLVLNTSSVTLLPVTIFMYRAQAGALSSTDVFLPILVATSMSTLVGLLSVAIIQKLPIYKPVVLLYLLGFAIFLSAIGLGITHLSAQQLTELSSLSANLILFSFICFALSYGYLKKLDVYSLFIDGAKQGFKTAIDLIPFLLAMLVAIAALRGSGLLDLMTDQIRHLLVFFSLPSQVADSLPTAFMKPFSGSGSRALMLESFEQFGVDSLAGKITSVMQGSTETTFYVLAVYFGAVGIKFGRHALFCGLLADLIGLLTAVIISLQFFQ